MERKHLCIRCVSCMSHRLRPLGVSSRVAGFGYDPDQHEEIKYQCLDCKEKFFVVKRANADHDDFEAPFTVTFTRAKKFVGALMPYTVFLNGVKVASVANGQSVRFTTNKLNNEIVVTDHRGVAFEDYLPFMASEGGSMKVDFAFRFDK